MRIVVFESSVRPDEGEAVYITARARGFQLRRCLGSRVRRSTPTPAVDARSPVTSWAGTVISASTSPPPRR